MAGKKCLMSLTADGPTHRSGFARPAHHFSLCHRHQEAPGVNVIKLWFFLTDKEQNFQM
jgi:hypothetical protein